MLLITGKNGQLGLELKKFYNSKQAIFTHSSELDITQIETILPFFQRYQISLIINCAAYTLVDQAEKEANLCFKVNIEGVKNLSLISSKFKVPLIHISTDYVFDGTHHVPYQESDILNPQTIYGKSKAESERIFMKEAYAGIILRTSWVFSEFGNNFLKSIIKVGKTKKELKVVFDQIGTPTYAYDIANLIYEILPKIKSETKEIYHFSNEGIASWYDVAWEIIQKKKINCDLYPIETHEYPTLAKRPHYSVLNKQKIKNTFNIQIRHWKEALHECLEKIS